MTVEIVEAAFPLEAKAVDPVGRADPVFLAAARKHLMARWRYKPAIQGGRPVSCTAVVTLRFELDN